MPNSPQTKATLMVDKTTGAIVGPVNAATFAAGNSLAASGAPDAHAATHEDGGADEVTLAQGQITGLTAALAAKAAAADLTSHTGNVSNPHSVTKAQVGLTNADNTSDAAKPVSTATQTALDLKAPLASPALTGTPSTPTASAGTNTTQVASTAFVRAEVAALVASAPGTLDTLDEIAAALGDDPNLATTLTTAIGLKADASALTAHTGNTSNPHSVTKAQVGLSNADNTSDANKPVSTATQTALDLKQPLATVLTNTTAAFTSAQETKLSGVETGAQVNVALASQAEAEAGVETTKTMTPVRVAQAIAALAGSGGSKTIARWTADDNAPPLTNYATWNLRNTIPVLEFDDTTAESAVFSGVIPEGADLSVGIKRREFWLGKTATSGTVMSTGEFERGTTDLDADSFATGIDSAATTINGTSGIITVIETDHSSSEIDGLTAGDFFRFKITRKVSGDSMTGDGQLVAVELRSR